MFGFGEKRTWSVAVQMSANDPIPTSELRLRICRIQRNGSPYASLLMGWLRRSRSMNEELRKKILSLLDEHRIMTIATLRPDGWPQATTVGYANDGLTLYFLCGPDSQKAANLARDGRVSLTIDHDVPQVMEITGLSMAAHAKLVLDQAEGEKALRLLMLKYPHQTSLPLPMPTPADVRIFRVTPIVISVLDYSKGFAHTDLITC
jgi:nitroimidazol reductase NimA-like FMN-containing flavoprotein (pyridoxamine 5'-phosphate oxidase superfamily)